MIRVGTKTIEAYGVIYYGLQTALTRRTIDNSKIISNFWVNNSVHKAKISIRRTKKYWTQEILYLTFLNIDSALSTEKFRAGIIQIWEQ